MLKFLIFLLLCCGLKCVSGTDVPAGNTAYLKDRLHGGRYVSQKKAPFIVSIQRKSSSTSTGAQHICAGIILRINIILTVAQCVHNEVLSNLQIRAGSSCPHSDGQIRRFRFCKEHPCFNSETKRHDLAVCILDAALNFDATVGMAHIWKFAPGNYYKTRAYGYSSDQGGFTPHSTSLVMVTPSFVRYDECRVSFRYNNQTIHYGMCCGKLAFQDSCKLNRGGPLTRSGGVVALFSWGEGCAENVYPGVYTLLLRYLAWVYCVVNQLNKMFATLV